VSLENILEEPNADPLDVRRDDGDAAAPAGGFAVRLVETEGRHRKVKLRSFKTPRRARQRNFVGKTLAPLPIEDDAVVVNMTAYEIADVELLFE
jgi:alpha-mannosidase